MSRITQYATLSSPAAADVLPIVDVDDTSMAATGTTKKIAVSALLASTPGNTDWLNVVTQYGADPTGTADSTTAIQTALTAAAAATYGGVVYFPAGLYLISQTLQAGSSTTVTGDGIGATTIRVKASSLSSFTQVGSNGGATMLATAGNAAKSRITVSDLTLDMNEANNSSVPGFAIAAECSPAGIQNVTGLTVERVEVINAVGYSVFPRGCTDVKIRGCRVIAGQASNGYANQDGIHVTDCAGVIIDGNYIDTGTISSVGDDAIAIQGVSAGCSDVTVTGNVIEHSAAHGISLFLGGATVTDVTISGNVVKNTISEGLLFFYTTYVSSGTYLVTDVSVTGNVFKNIATANTASGITLQDAYGGTSSHVGTAGYAGVVIAGNVLDGFTNTSGFGIYAQAGSDLTISDNTFRNWAAVRGIDIGDNSSSTSRTVTRFAVCGNTIDMTTTTATAPAGIEVVDSPDGVITGNTILGAAGPVASSIGISLLSIGTAITGSAVNNNRVKTWATAISETNNGAAPDYNVLVGNNCHGNTAFISQVGTHDVVASNVVA